MDWSLVVTIIIGAFTMSSVLVGAVRRQRKSDKKAAKEARDKLETTFTEGYEKLHSRITSEIKQLRQEVDACDMGREESLTVAMKNVEEKLDKKVGTDLFKQAMDFMKETVTIIRDDNLRVVREIKKETKQALSEINTKVEKLAS